MKRQEAGEIYIMKTLICTLHHTFMLRLLYPLVKTLCTQSAIGSVVK
jgi:hypothetical protein